MDIQLLIKQIAKHYPKHSHYKCSINESYTDNTIKTNLLKELVQILAKQPSALEEFMQSKQPKSHAEAEFWQKYFEYRGL